MTEDTITRQKVVTFTYVILDENQSVQEQSDIPMSYLHGVDGKMFEKVEAELEGKKVGDVIAVTLDPIDAFGEHDPSLTYRDALENIPPEYQRVGVEATFEDEEGERLSMVVTKIENGEVVLDGNHPYAGKRMTFQVTVKEIRAATLEEVGSGEVVDLDEPPSIIH